jgi:plasmid stabilization system protein ParE
MIYSVKWSEKAQSDYLQIIDYLIENWGRKSAKNFKHTIEHIVDIISIIPEF